MSVSDTYLVQSKTELVRVAIVHSNGGSLVSRAVQAALVHTQSVTSSLLSYLQAIFSLPGSAEIQQIIDIANNYTLDSDRIVDLLFGAEVNSTIAEHTIFSTIVLGLAAGQNALVSNGKVCTYFLRV